MPQLQKHDWVRLSCDNQECDAVFSGQSMVLILGFIYLKKGDNFLSPEWNISIQFMRNNIHIHMQNLQIGNMIILASSPFFCVLVFVV